jgi:hypothetical protein
MTTKKLLLVVTLAAGLILPNIARSAEIRVEVGDRPYYTHGERYWDGDWEMVWIPGHWDKHHEWVHGHYKHGENRHYHHHDHDDDNR